MCSWYRVCKLWPMHSVDVEAFRFKGVEPVNISSMCTVFAESEVVSLVAEGTSKKLLQQDYPFSCNKPILVSRVGSEDKVFFSGGVSEINWKIIKRKLGRVILSKKVHFGIASVQL